MDVAVLFARRDSVYKTLPCDVWDADRNALNWPGGCPVVAHPPCRSWGNWQWKAKPEPGERELAPWSVQQVRRWGGVLEHPRSSHLWPEYGLPKPGERDEWGGFTFPVLQFWFGHRAEKATNLYICGCSPSDLPPLPLVLGTPSHKVELMGVREREQTPPAFAEWLLSIARLCRFSTEYPPAAPAGSPLLTSFVCLKTELVNGRSPLGTGGGL